MEMLIVLVLLALSEKNSELKETLQSVLAFYRENRELFLSLSNAQQKPLTVSGSAPSSCADESIPPPDSKPENTSEPPPEESLKLIEEFLRRQKI